MASNESNEILEHHGDGDCMDETNRTYEFTHYPIVCPITDCDRVMTGSTIMAHYLHDTHSNSNMDFQELFGGKRTIIIFDEDIIQYGKVVCLGALAFGGSNCEDKSTLPVVAGICSCNELLFESEQKLKDHLPMLVMATKISWTTVLRRKDTGKIADVPPTNPHDMVFAIWVVGPETTCNIYVTLTVFNKEMNWSRSTIIKCRRFHDTAAPKDFLVADCFLRLMRSDVNCLTNHGNSAIHLEIIVNDIDYSEKN